MENEKSRKTIFASVIVPIYNKENYLDRCIMSILNQSYTCFELILIDDGSNDRSKNICDFYKKQDNRIRVIHQANGGISHARNAGLNISRGEYIFFIDPDDYISNDLLQDTFDNVNKTAADIVLFGVKTVCGKRVLKDNSLHMIANIPHEKLKIYLSCIGEWEVWRKAYKRDVWENVRFMDKMRTCEDVYITPKIMEKAHKFSFLKNTYYFWERKPHGSLMQSRRAYSYYEEFIAWKFHITIHNLDSDIYKKICRFRCLESILKALYMNKKDHTLQDDHIHEMMNFIDECGYKGQKISPVLLYYFSFMKYSEMEKFKSNNEDNARVIKQAIKLYVLDQRYHCLMDDQRQELFNMINHYNNKGMKTIYRIMSWCIGHQKMKILNISGYLLAQKKC